MDFVLTEEVARVVLDRPQTWDELLERPNLEEMGLLLLPWLLLAARENELSDLSDEVLRDIALDFEI